MVGWFQAPTFEDPQLGTLTRKRGLWRGTLALDGPARVPLALSGSRREPDPAALATARGLAGQFASWRPILARELFAHAEPYAESVAADGEPRSLPASSADVWPHVSLQSVAITPLDGTLTTELAFTTAWDDEHTLGARFRGDSFVELCGSVLPP